MRVRQRLPRVSKSAAAALLFSILLGICGQLLMKHGALGASTAATTLHGAFTIAAAVLVYSVGIGCWILALRSLPLSVAYPVTSLSYVGILWGSSVWFGEHITPLRMLGVALIFAGVALVVLNEGTQAPAQAPSRASSES